MKKMFSIEFEDESAKARDTRWDSISHSCSGDELLKVSGADGVPFVYGNSAGLVTLGEMLIEIGLSEYRNGFHVHIYEDFDADKPEILIIVVQNPN